MPLLSAPPAQRSALLSLFQSAAAEHAALRTGQLAQAAAVAARLRAAGQAPPQAAPGGVASDSWTCARLGLAWLEAALHGDAEAQTRLRSELHGSACDPGWIETLVRYAGQYGPGGRLRPIPYRPPSAATGDVLPLPAGARVALISDWGLGTVAAQRVLAQALASRPDVLIHLGDVYYSGTIEEYERNFRVPLAGALAAAGLEIPVYILSGNHDMYSGGEGFYGALDRLNTPPLRQRASWFCLRSPAQDWQLLAMDTGLHDRDPFDMLGAEPAQTFLAPEELAWHRARIDEFPGRTILLSHHPLFSAFQAVRPAGVDGTRRACNQALLDGFASAIASGRIAAWFWGHEHALSIYGPHVGLERGRCVGNGAIPVLLADDPYRPLPGLVDPPRLLPGIVPGRDGAVYAHGSALLRLGAAASVEYYQTTQAQPLYVESLDERPFV